ncbi:MAG: precorrin-6y C5,15-methyltransferase (decarboxylating) subunit CbiE, partial [Hyphomicrobiales bacterium]|nr:precorrin-6y C5,15-methyltransferase (decarboxylating) subunit CbiE [Hyphomicrobiales bacterium]
MSGPWLHIIGIGAEGIDSLMPAARALLDSAEVIIGGERHLGFAESNLTAERIAWPSPFSALVETIATLKGRRVVVLATGDPLWYSVGARLGRAFPLEEIDYHPQLSAFQLIACRMGWSLADSELLTTHGRPNEQVVPYFHPGARLLILGGDGNSPREIGRLLVECGYEKSPITVFASMGAGDEARFDGTAEAPPLDVPDFHTLAVECVASPQLRVLGRVPGLPDDAFRHDGKMTKREVRAATLSRLVPARGALLWDIGAGCGSVAIEWMRAAR